MKDLINFIVGNPLILILVAGWLLSSLGGLGAKAARKAAKQRQAQRPQKRAEQTTLPSAMAQPAPAPAPRPTPARRPAVPDPDEIAAELRRLMGLELEEPARPEPVVVQPPPPIVVEIETPHRREMPSAHMPSADTGVRHAAPTMRVASRTSQRRRGSTGALLDLSNPAAAFVALEVLGPPRALRSWD